MALKITSNFKGIQAAKNAATFIRVGSKIMGKRD